MTSATLTADATDAAFPGDITAPLLALRARLSPPPIRDGLPGLDDAPTGDDSNTVACDAVTGTVDTPGDAGPATDTGIPSDDEIILEKIMGSENGEAYFTGDASAWGGDKSRRDLAMVGLLAFYVGLDRRRIDRLFRKSKCMRAKWDERRGVQAYGEMTIATALSGRREFYRWDRHEPAGDGAKRARASKGPSEAYHLQPFTDYGNAQRLAARFAGRVRYDVSSKRFMVYDGSRWTCDDTGHVQRVAKAVGREMVEIYGDRPVRDEARRFAHYSESARGIAAALELVKSEPGVAVAAADFDSDPFLLNVANGTIDLRTGRLRPHDPADLITKQARASYDPAAVAPTWAAFLSTVFAGDAGLMRYVRKWAGYCASGDISTQEMPVLWGGGANGKSTFLDALAYVLGDYASIAPPGLLTTKNHEGHPTELADLQGLRMVIASETEEGAKLRTQLVKALTGDPTVKARRMRTDFYSYPRTFKLVLATNNRPRVNENTEAVWRRLRLIPFNVTIPPEARDPDLGAKLRAEADGILCYIVAGFLDRAAEGMSPPESVAAATDAYREDEDTLTDFIDARLVFGPAARVARTALYAAYTQWAASVGEKYPMGPKGFYDRIRRLEGVGDKRWKPLGTNDAVRGFEGVTLRQTGGEL